MIVHTLIYAFEESVTQEQREQFLAELQHLTTSSPLVIGFDYAEHQWLPVDDKSKGTTGQVIASYVCPNLAGIKEFSERPETHEFISRWRQTISYRAAYANHRPLQLLAPEGTVMRHTEHTVTVHAPAQLVWEVLTDVEGYARIFPPTERVTVLEESPTHQIARLTVRVSGELQSWVSRRDIDEGRRIIAYQQLEKAPMMGHMGGQWRALPIDESTTQLVLTHDFKSAEPVDGLIAGKFTVAEADERLGAAVEHNSVADLTAVKETAELRVRAETVEEAAT